jgi:phage-related protein
LPPEIVGDFGYALGAVQMGATPAHAKPWKGEGGGVLELVESHRGDTFRAVYAVRFARAVYVLHCFQKKSPSGIRTAQSDIDLIHERLKLAQQHHKEHYERQS